MKQNDNKKTPIQKTNETEADEVQVRECGAAQ